MERWFPNCSPGMAAARSVDYQELRAVRS
jgi:hypothetical protein